MNKLVAAVALAALALTGATAANAAPANRVQVGVLTCTVTSESGSEYRGSPPANEVRPSTRTSRPSRQEAGSASLASCRICS